MSRPKILLFIVVVCLSLQPVAARAQTVYVDYDGYAGEALPYYGSNPPGWDNGGNDMINLRINQSGMNIFRMQLISYLIEPVNDNADPNTINWAGFRFNTTYTLFGITLSMDVMFTSLNRSGSYMILNFPYLPPWLSSNSNPNPLYGTYPPNSLPEYKEHVKATLLHLVNDIGVPPEKIFLEPFNEPDLGCGVDPSVPCFWQDHTMQDTVDTFLVAYDAAKEVDPAIKVIGMSEWDNGRYVRNFINNHNGLDYLDAITYHKYMNGYDISSMISMGVGFKNDYGIPVIVDEYGSRNYYSNGVPGALWHSRALTQLWNNDLNPVSFPFWDVEPIGSPYNRMGLFYNASLGWNTKPAFWVYSNFIRFMSNCSILPYSESISNLDFIASRKGSELHFITTNIDSTPKSLNFVIDGMPPGTYDVTVYNNLYQNSVVQNLSVSGNFNYTVPGSSSLSFSITPSSANLCLDGTPYGSCNATKPWFCSNDSMILNCSACGCDLPLACQPDGSCVNQTECTPGQNRSCNTGLLGLCSNGTQVCDPQGFWGSCMQVHNSTSEICNDNEDNDCDGFMDCSDVNCSGSAGCHGLGDLNSDTIVNIFDIVLIGSHFGLTPASPGWDEKTDPNNDYVVNIGDLLLVSGNFGNTY